MRYYIIAGEASGDMHAANLVAEIKKQDANAIFQGWGGDKMQLQGVRIVKHYRDLAFMGFVEVAKNLKTILKNLSFCKKDIVAFKPNAVILVDYPGFNMRIAEFLKQQGIKVFYYISPQIWAWKQSRVHKIKRTVDKMFVILPFEKDFYKKFNYDVEFVGHPLLDEIKQVAKNDEDFNQLKIPNDKKIVAIIPGSRTQEIANMLPVMVQVAKKFPNYCFVIAAAKSIPQSFYKKFTSGSNIFIVTNQTYRLLRYSYAAMVTSGTATLETALFEVPEVVCYKGNVFSYLIARQLVKVKYISLVNLILDKPLVKELIQNNFNEDTLTEELTLLLDNTIYRESITQGYIDLKNRLGNSGASAKAATIMVKET